MRKNFELFNDNSKIKPNFFELVKQFILFMRKISQIGKTTFKLMLSV